MTRDELAREIYDFLDYHNVLSGEAYKFNIKVHSIDIPDELRDLLYAEDIDTLIQRHMREALTDHVEELKQEFPWIREWAQAGRMGGWLVLAPHNPVLVIGHRPDGVAVPEVEPEDVKAARKRLRDLEKIKSLTKEGIKAMVSELESSELWQELVPDYKPRSRKHWDPRDPRMSGRKDWDPRPGDPVLVMVDEMEVLPEGRRYAATIYRWAPERFHTVEEFMGSPDRDEYHLDRSEYHDTPEAALAAGNQDALRAGYNVVSSESFY